MTGFDLIEEWACSKGYYFWSCTDDFVHTCRYNAGEYATHLPVINLCGGLTLWGGWKDVNLFIIKPFEGYSVGGIDLRDPEVFDKLNEIVNKWKTTGSSSAW